MAAPSRNELARGFLALSLLLGFTLASTQGLEAFDNTFDDAEVVPIRRNLRASAGAISTRSAASQQTQSFIHRREDFASGVSMGSCFGTGYHQRYQPQFIKNQGNGPVLNKPIAIYMMWVGNVSDSRKALLRTFVRSLNPQPVPQFTVDDWWNVTSLYWGGSFRGAVPTGGWTSNKISIAGEYTVAQCDLISYGIITNTPTEDDIWSIIQKTIPKAGWPVSQNAIYFVFTDETLIPGYACDPLFGYCGYYNNTNYAVNSMKSVPITFAWTGLLSQCLDQCASNLLNTTTDSIDEVVHGAINIFAALLATAATNPQFNAWADNNGGGIYSICGNSDNPFGNSSTWWNMKGLGNQKFLVQGIWDAMEGQCVLGIRTVR